MNLPQQHAEQLLNTYLKQANKALYDAQVDRGRTQQANAFMQRNNAVQGQLSAQQAALATQSLSTYRGM